MQSPVCDVGHENPPGRNFCFLNTCLQQLKYTPYLADYLTSGQYRHNLRSDIGLEESLAVAFSSFLQLSALASPGEVISPEVVHTILGKVDSRFNNYQQHDAAEAMATILDRLTYETSSVYGISVYGKCVYGIWPAKKNTCV